MRAVAKQSITERDRLLTYTIGEYYNEMSMFISEQESAKKAHEEAMAKTRMK